MAVLYGGHDFKLLLLQSRARSLLKQVPSSYVGHVPFKQIIHRMTAVSFKQPAEHIKNRDTYVQEPSISRVQWPPFVPTMPRQIDTVLVYIYIHWLLLYVLTCTSQYMVTVEPDHRGEEFMKELSEYIVMKRQALVAEKSLIVEHQLMVNPPQLVGLLALHGVCANRIYIVEDQGRVLSTSMGGTSLCTRLTSVS